MSKLTELAARCIRCGFCIESCPTFQLTGDESQSPRGRISLARQAEESGVWDDTTRSALDTCLGCRGCETACPSGVQYGEIIELARAAMPRQRWLEEPFLASLTNPAAARAQFALGGLIPGGRLPGVVSRMLTGSLPEAEIPRLPDPAEFPLLPSGSLPPVVGEVYLLEGCVMRVLYPDVHQALRRLLRRIGFTVREVRQGCCGALHAHSGFLDEAESRAQALGEAFPDELPLLVDSAGCGSTIKGYGTVVGKGLEGLAARTWDATEFLLANGLAPILAESPGLPGMRIAYHEACHLVHGQKVSAEPKTLLASIPGVELAPLAEADLCCGSAGTYNVFHPQYARRLLDRKWANIAATGAQIVAMGNPGCQSWIAQAARENGSAIRVAHTLSVLESSFSGLTV
ncbi:MAG: (Fe-S)-binding protein [Armatimonadetes bacterium]|nr:(Fe-S)-binding protein [Armatimonadota bacterium]